VWKHPANPPVPGLSPPVQQHDEQDGPPPHTSSRMRIQGVGKRGRWRGRGGRGTSSTARVPPLANTSRAPPLPPDLPALDLIERSRVNSLHFRVTELGNMVDGGRFTRGLYSFLNPEPEPKSPAPQRPPPPARPARRSGVT